MWEDVREWLRAVKLYCGIVGRETQFESRLGPILAWEIARGVCPPRKIREQERREVRAILDYCKGDEVMAMRMIALGMRVTKGSSP